MVGSPVARFAGPVDVQFCGDEATTLQRFFTWWSEADPDIVGWNWSTSTSRFAPQCESLGVAFAFGRGDEPATVLARRAPTNPGGAHSGPGGARRRRPAACGVLAREFHRRVAQSLLGERKLITDSGLDKLDEIKRQYREAPLELARYNARDCELVLKIFERADLLAFASNGREPGSRSTGSADRLPRLTTCLPRLHRRGRVALSLAQVVPVKNPVVTSWIPFQACIKMCWCWISRACIRASSAPSRSTRWAWLSRVMTCAGYRAPVDATIRSAGIDRGPLDRARRRQGGEQRRCLKRSRSS